MNRKQYKFEMEASSELMAHLDNAPGTAPHRKRNPDNQSAEKTKPPKTEQKEQTTL